MLQATSRMVSPRLGEGMGQTLSLAIQGPGEVSASRSGQAAPHLNTSAAVP